MGDEAATWRAWKQATFGSEYEIWHDGLDLGAVTGLRGERRGEALTMLRLGLSLGDDRAAQALAAMGDESQLDGMRALLGASTGSQRVRLALALHRLQPDPALAAHLIAVLTSAAHWGERIDAAIGLRGFSGAHDEAALLAAVADPEYLVRNHACESLLARWRVKPAEISKHRDIFARIVGPREGPDSDADLTHRAEARAMLLALRR